MKPLVLTGYPITYFDEENLGDLAVNFFLRFVWGQLPSTDELAAYLGSRTPDHGPSRGHHWSDFASRWWGGTRLTNDFLWRLESLARCALTIAAFVVFSD